MVMFSPNLFSSCSDLMFKFAVNLEVDVERLLNCVSFFNRCTNIFNISTLLAMQTLHEDYSSNKQVSKS